MRDASSSRRSSRTELRFLEALHRRCPDHAPLLEALGHLYTDHGRYAEGLDIDLKLTAMRPSEPQNWYNLACSFALTRQPARAIETLRKAIELGYDDAEWMAKDDDLVSLRKNPAFRVLLSELRGRNARRR